MIVIGSDLRIQLTGLYDEHNEAYVNNATATAYLLEHTGTQIATITLDYESGSDGDYSGIIPAITTATLTAFHCYTIRITASYSGNTYQDEIHTIAQGSSY